MRELVIGDLHFGIKSNSIIWLNQQIKFFNDQIIPAIENQNVDRIVFLGDLTDIRYAINQQVGITIQKLFRTILNKFPDKQFYMCAGNHDYYSPLEEFIDFNSYDLMFPSEFVDTYPNLTIINKDPLLTEDGALFLPWYWTENTKHIDEILYNFDFNDEVKEVFCHTDLSIWPGARIAAFKGCPIYSGHIHYEYIDPISNLYNLGSACAFTFNDVNSDKYLYIIEDYKIVDKIKNITTPQFKRLFDEQIFDAPDEIFTNSYVQLCISSNNINKAKYVERIKELKTKYINSNIRLHVIDNDTDINTLTVTSFTTNIDKYIDDNIPQHLDSKYRKIKNMLVES